MDLKPESIKYLIVHHTATARDTTTFDAVKKYHISKGWGDIGYHYFITADGKIWPGRAENIVGAHASSSDMNFKSLGICLTGNFMDEKDFIKIVELGIPFVIDEAYIEYAGLKKSQSRLIKKYKNVIITRTMSKAYGLAGLQFGYLLADREVAMKIAASLLPWNVGTITMWAALTGLEDQKGLAKRVKFTNDQARLIEKAMSTIPGMIIFPTKANYVLFDAGGTGKNGDDIISFAKKKGMILRGQKTMYGSEGWFRVTIGTSQENKLFIKTMKEFFGKK